MRVDRFDIVGEPSSAAGRQVLHVEVDCWAGHLRSLRWPPTSVGSSAPAPTCATCAAPQSSRSRSTRPRRPTSCALLPPIEAVRALARVTVDDDDSRRDRRRQATARAAGDGPWAMVTDAGTLLAVYESFGEGTAKPAVVLGDAG